MPSTSNRHKPFWIGGNVKRADGLVGRNEGAFDLAADRRSELNRHIRGGKGVCVKRGRSFKAAGRKERSTTRRPLPEHPLDTHKMRGGGPIHQQLVEVEWRLEILLGGRGKPCHYRTCHFNLRAVCHSLLFRLKIGVVGRRVEKSSYAKSRDSAVLASECYIVYHSIVC